MLVAMTARWKERESPTLMGIVGSCGATPPASKRMTKFGACVRCASIAAAHGTPVPTAAVRPSSRRRAAQQIINSIALKAGFTLRSSAAFGTGIDEVFSAVYGTLNHPAPFYPVPRRGRIRINGRRDDQMANIRVSCRSAVFSAAGASYAAGYAG